MPFAPGLAVVAVLVAAATGVWLVEPALSPVLVALVLGALAGRHVRRHPSTSPGVGLAATTLLRVGVALLGLRVSLGELADVGAGGFALALGTLAVTFTATARLGRRLGVDGDLALLIATGSAICGASAIAAMDTVTRAREEAVGYAVAVVTILGTVAMLLLPLLAPALGLDGVQAGMWSGASIQEVAQATAAGAAVSAVALKAATLVKLCRVVLLGPAVVAVGLRRGTARQARVPVPGFVLAFLALVVVRSVVPVPGAVLDVAAVASTTLLAAALAAMGIRIRLSDVRRAGSRPLALGLAAWLIAAVTALALLLALGL
ncbi:MAG TPA: putative sulfate exporter family transporter [Baekduia sp.]|nr:putative sulfate exporter family transporter [Baekduia sp.]